MVLGCLVMILLLGLAVGMPWEVRLWVTILAFLAAAYGGAQEFFDPGSGKGLLFPVGLFVGVVFLVSLAA